MEMATIAITGIIGFARKRKNFPVRQPQMATIFRIAPIFRAPFGKYMPNQEVEIGKVQLKGDYPVNFLDTW